MRILPDENLPRGLVQLLAPRVVTTVQEAGFAGMKNGQRLAAIETMFDVFVTADKNLRYQQNLVSRQLAIVELPTNRWPLLRLLQDRLTEVIDGCESSSYTVVSLPDDPEQASSSQH